LSKDELQKADRLLTSIRRRLATLSAGDGALHWALRRKVYKELTYDERGKPSHRRRLKKVKRAEQRGICPVCDEALPERYVVLDRLEAMDGYTPENTQLIHRHCDNDAQRSRGYT
jgi:ribosomal protein L44E